MCRDDIRHRRGQPRSGGGGGKLRSGAADRAVSQSALRAAGHRRQPDHGTAGLFRHPGARQHQPGAGRGRTRADLGAQRDLAIGYVPSVGGRHGCSHRQRGPRALRHPAARTAGARSRAPRRGHPAGPACWQAVDLHAAGHLRPATGHRPVGRHRGHLRAWRWRAPQPRGVADRRRTDGAAVRGQPVAPAGAAAAAPSTGDHAGPADTASSGIGAAGRRRSAGIRIDNRSTLAGCLG
ncbi:Uncharacterised protein [Mycobacterium tuberculosis]|nr:Uncharacterised protein [Mycobacterium tuberculosis]CNW41196.1 Uncharacterised protein [Mycobacterium tuberculosis]CNW46689.1 Uncharacterised protein [Mycobacterium tuberculosis]CNW66996.1 Uncharacterised protein [Mycobacterium tuberculosis]CNY84842.1 Uncharacterised protein [Mycobacterium tuberculosis]